VFLGSYGGNPQPDVVPGRVHEDPDPYGGAKSTAKPKHKHLKKLSNAEARRCGKKPGPKVATDNVSLCCRKMGVSK